MRFEDHDLDVCLSCLRHIPKLLLLSPLFDVLSLDTVPVLALPSAKLPVCVHASLQILWPPMAELAMVLDSDQHLGIRVAILLPVLLGIRTTQRPCLTMHN
ncbi:hypothetical protein DPMN_077688 [Dreissena polymorpha]|uniref:Uncharacterized protein n=1 Tax=Dreissena polymorpha TaxID=45954 RepID=A0A9D4BRK4_DREPO|nr:hypothetical protein DPMN_077688 [Dreissena polymorpha]